MTVLREVLARFGIQVEAGPLESLDEGIGAVVGNLQRMGAALAAGTAVNAVRAFVQEMADAADQLDETATRLGISTTGLQEWQHAARMNGVEDLTGSLGILQRNLAGAAEGNQEAAGSFRRLGVQVRGADGQIRSMDDILVDIAEGMRGIENPTERAGMATRLFGRSGAQLVPLLSQGAEGVAQLRAEFQQLGGGASAEMVERSAELNDQLDRLDLAFFSIKARLANVLLPIFIRSAEVTTELVANFTAMADRSHVLEAAIVVLAAVAIAAGIGMSAAWAGPIAITALVAAGIAFLILLVDDLITLFSGGRSVIGGFIDEMFGAGTAAQLVYELTEAWEGLKLAVTDAYHAVQEFFGTSVPTTADGQPIATQRGLDPATAITAEEDAFRDMFRRASEGERIDPEERQRVVSAYRAQQERRRASVASGGATVAVPAGAGGTSSSVVIDSPVSITLPPGTPRDQATQLRQVVGEVLDERNRQAAAALGSEAVEE